MYKNKKMTRKYLLNLDTDTQHDSDGPFYTVNYIKESDEAREQRVRKTAHVAKFMREINRNALTKYLYEKETDQRHAARRLAKTSGWDNKSFEYVMNYIKANWNNSGEPTIIGSRSACDEGYTSRMTFRQQLYSARKVKQDSSARMNAVERAAESGSFERRVFDQTFIDQVKQTRAAKELTQQELANRINRPVNDLAKFERGELDYDGELKNLLHNALEFNIERTSL
jgi:ribosome-binding protein aMBF1 (putative translation factor)